tara:strand:+ start:12803 stop:14422 length:1620 start_codon:yes stop_codon:yes gene_type:complete
LCLGVTSSAQQLQKLLDNPGQIHGNFEMNGQYYQEDDAIDAEQPDEEFGFNGYLNLIYNRGNFEAGLRYESYQNALLGYSTQFEGNGIMYRYAKYKADNLEFTVGNFYEQFGNGQILRTYFDPGFGIDNSIDGVRVKYNFHGVYLKGLIGQQRNYFDYGEGIVRGLDGEISLNELLSPMATSPFRFTLGGSLVSKYQEDNSTVYTLPENVMSYGGRFNLNYKGFNLNGEYTYKNNDPSADNDFSYRPGQAYFLSTSYSKKGFGITLSAKTLDNMFFRSDRNNSSQFPELYINFIPTLTKQHTYNLMSTLYPYAIQYNGEMSYQADIIYTFKKGTPLGGKYGTTVQFNASYAANVDTTALNDEATDRQINEVNLFKGGEKFWHDINIEISKKFSKKFKAKFTYQNLFYNIDVIQGKPGEPNIEANVGVADLLFKLDKKNAIRTELQALFTEQDNKDWATVLVEWTHSPNWFVSVMDQYNYGNDNVDDRQHYLTANVGYIKDGTRITLGYGRQRAGIFCVGGVCRVVPASSGVTLSITSSF